MFGLLVIKVNFIFLFDIWILMMLLDGGFDLVLVRVLWLDLCSGCF